MVKIISARRCVKLLAFKHVTETAHKTTPQKLIKKLFYKSPKRGGL